jgi:hypothetical protein
MGRHVVENGCAIEQLGFAISIGSRSGMDEVNGCRAAIYACDALLALAQNLANSAEQLAGFFEITRWMGRHVVENGCAIEQLGFAISIGLRICSSWRSSWITAAMQSTRKGRTRRCCLTSSAISTCNMASSIG